MGSKPFRFKKFSIAHDRCTHKVGTDGVLLGAWVNVCDADRRILDIGTGSGLIAIMLAQRSGPHAHIDALDIEAPDVRQARENAAASLWPAKVEVHHTSLQQFFPGRQYDLIVSNPPWFVNSLLPPDERRRMARHTAELPFDDLLTHALRLLSPAGRLALILPHREGLNFQALARDNGLVSLRQATFRARAHKNPERLLMELAASGYQQEAEELILYDGENWSAQYTDLTRAFYLKG